MTDSFKIQVNVKVPHDSDNYRDTLVNVRADSEAELTALLDYVENNGAKIGSVVAALRAGANVGNAFVPPSPAPAQQDQGSWSQQGSQQAPPAFAPQPQAAPQGGGFGGPPTKYDLSGPPGPAAQCNHGAMEWRHRTSRAGKEYKGWFCPSKDQNQQCDAQFVR